MDLLSLKLLLLHYACLVLIISWHNLPEFLPQVLDLSLPEPWSSSHWQLCSVEGGGSHAGRLLRSLEKRALVLLVQIALSRRMRACTSTLFIHCATQG